MKYIAALSCDEEKPHQVEYQIYEEHAQLDTVETFSTSNGFGPYQKHLKAHQWDVY